MKPHMLLTLLCSLVIIGCQQSPTGPSLNTNLLINPIFEQNGMASLNGWVVVDSVGVRLSSDVPSSVSGHSIIVGPSWLPTWPIGIVYQGIPASAGTHIYRLSVFGKKSGVSGGVAVRLNRPENNPVQGWLPGITVMDTIWTSYSRDDTVTAASGDTLFFAVQTGACELCTGRTNLASCGFEELK